MKSLAVRLALALLASACGPSVASDSNSTTSTALDDGGTTTLTSNDPSRPTTTTGTTSTTNSTSDAAADTRADTSTSAADDEGAFIVRSDGPQDTECDIWIDDCPPDLKCMPWANDGGSSWNATKCTPIADDAKDVGDPCSVEDTGVSGIDDCVARAMCWDVDPETNMGTCIGMCSGDVSAPVCADPCTSCAIYNEGVLILCLPACDPILQNCQEGNGCYPSFDDLFACAPDSAAEQGALGDACEFLNVCDPGLFCGDADLLPNCDSNIGCCTPFCDVDADAPCPDTLPGTECIPWFAEGEAPPCFAQTIGGCLLP